MNKKPAKKPPSVKIVNAKIKKHLKEEAKRDKKFMGVTSVSRGKGQKHRVSASETALVPAVIQPSPLPVVTADKIVAYMDTFGLATQLEPNEKKQFTAIATEFGLNPFKREIYCVAYGTGDKRKLSIITGYEVYLKRAERSGCLDGWAVETTGVGKDMKSTITINRKDRSCPIKKTVQLVEYIQTTWKDGKKVPTKFWEEKPVTMLEKVAMAQGFRLAFPDELGGMPYTADELPDEMTGRMEKSVIPPRAETKPRDVTPDAPQCGQFDQVPPEPQKHETDDPRKTLVYWKAVNMQVDLKKSGLFQAGELDTYKKEITEALGDDNALAIIYGEMEKDFNSRNILKTGKPAIQPDIF